MKSNNNDILNVISEFKDIKNEFERFINEIYRECLEKILKNDENINNTVKVKFNEIKNSFLSNLQSKINLLEKLKENFFKNNFKFNTNTLNIKNIDNFKIISKKIINENNENEKNKNSKKNKPLINLFNSNNQNKILNKKENEIQKIENLKKEIRDLLYNNKLNFEFKPPPIHQNILSFSNELNEGLMEEDSNNSEEDNFEFLRFDNEIFINNLKGQTFDDEDNRTLIEKMKKKLPLITLKEYSNQNNENEEIQTTNLINQLNNNNKISFNNSNNDIELNSFSNLGKIITNTKESIVEDRWPFKIQNIYSLYIHGIYQKEINFAISTLKWDERNLTEFLFFNQNSTIIYAYNVFLKIREKIEMDFRTPLNFSYLNIPSYVFLSGGKDLTFKDLYSVYRIRRLNQNEVSIEKYSQLIINRSSHSSIYIPLSNLIIFISGSNTNSCEQLNIKTKIVKRISDLNFIRENSSPCLINDTDLYVFFGYNSQNNKYLTSIEKMDLRTKLKWDLINIKVNNLNQNLCKKQNLSSIPYKLNNKESILLLGGIGEDNMESKDVFIYFISSKSISPIKSKLSSLVSFTHPTFVEYGIEDADYVFNVSNSGFLIMFSVKSGEFTPII